jgi:hypothetical protein
VCVQSLLHANYQRERCTNLPACTRIRLLAFAEQGMPHAHAGGLRGARREDVQKYTSMHAVVTLQNWAWWSIEGGSVDAVCCLLRDGALP